MTLEGLMDELWMPLNANVSFELNYDSHLDNKPRLIRSAIECGSPAETAKILLPLILADLCSIYGVSPKLSTSMA